MNINEINTRLAGAFQVNAQAKALQDIFADIMAQMEPKKISEVKKEEVVRSPHKSFSVHRPSICKKAGRIGYGQSCICQG